MDTNMNNILIVLLLVALCCQAYKKDMDEAWRKFKETYGKDYLKDNTMENKRRKAFELNVEKIAKHNLEYDMGLLSYRLGLNEYADMSNREFHHCLNGYQMNSEKSGNIFQSYPKDLPKNIDWRDKGVVTRVKSQKDCGSCWAFSSTGSLEGQHAKATGKLVSLSEQNLVDCNENNSGCSGGFMTTAFGYIIKNGGIATEESYPYTAEEGNCEFNHSTIGATMKNYTHIKSGDESSLQTAIVHIGPVSVAIDAKRDDFQFYQEGIYDNELCHNTNSNHAVLVVGYDTEDGKDYWIVKNSWGVTWGMDGYIKMIRNKNNQCGIATHAFYPIV